MNRTMNPVHEATNCAVAASAEIIGAKWTALLVHDLSEGPRRFSQLEKSCSGISPRTLAERLRALEHEGMVERRRDVRDRRVLRIHLTTAGRKRLKELSQIQSEVESPQQDESSEVPVPEHHVEN